MKASYLVLVLFLGVLGLPKLQASTWQWEELYKPRGASGTDGIRVRCTAREFSKSEEQQIDLATFSDGASALKEATYKDEAFIKCGNGVSCLLPNQTHFSSTNYADGFLDRSIVEVTCSGIDVQNVYKTKLTKRCWYPAVTPPGYDWDDDDGQKDGVNKCAEGSYQNFDDTDNFARSNPGNVLSYSIKKTDYYIVFNDAAVNGSNPIATVGADYYKENEYLSASDLAFSFSVSPNNITAKSGADLPSCYGSNDLCREGVKVESPSVKAFNGSFKFQLVARNKSNANKNISEVLLKGATVSVTHGAENLTPGNVDIAIPTTAAPSLSVPKKVSLADFPSASCSLRLSASSNYEMMGGVKVYKVMREKVGFFPVVTGLPDYLTPTNRSRMVWGNNASFSNSSNANPAQNYDVEGSVDLTLVDTNYMASGTVKFSADPNATINCPEVVVRRPAVANQVTLLPHSECGVFTALRGYYLTAPRGAPNLLFPGMENNLNHFLPPNQTPFVGLYNLGLRDMYGMVNTPNTPEYTPGNNITRQNSFTLEFNSSNYPAIDQAQLDGRPGRYVNRYYKGAYLVARLFSSRGMTEPVYWSEIGKDGNFKNILLSSTEGLQSLNHNGESLANLKDDDQVVFEIVVKKDEYGANGAMQPGLFGSADASSARFRRTHRSDTFIPFAGGSCIGSMLTPFPLRRDRGAPPLPASLSGLQVCQYSAPVYVKDVRAGKVQLNTLALTPPKVDFKYPVQLVMANKAPASCSVNNARDSSGDMKSCWEIKSYMPPTASSNPADSHANCLEQTCEWYNEARVVYYPCGSATCATTISVPQRVCYETYKPSCAVLETTAWGEAGKEDMECNANTAFRFDGFFSQMVASLGCVAKYGADPENPTQNETNNKIIRNNENQLVDLSGVEVAASLLGQGIIPYNTSSISRIVDVTASGPVYKDFPMGGANPANYTSASYSPKIQKNKARTQNLGYSCIPCQFNLPWLGNSNHNKNFDVAPLPLDHNFRESPRVPKYVFNRKRMPSSCVKDTNFEVRYFGASICEKRTNTSQLNAAERASYNNEMINSFCTSGNISAGTKCEGSNNAGAFSIPLCAGSEFGTNSVSASWSPILIDVSGNGMQVSRESITSVEFDMEGKGKKMLVDWPINTHEIAFLVEPDKSGKVTSIKQLFGDDKFANGFEKLKKYDSNKDRHITIQDKNFKKLRLWFDRNRNGVAEKEELEDLSAHGVTRINFDYVKSFAEGINALSLSSTYFNTKHQKYMNIVDVYFHGYHYRSGPAVSYKEKNKY